jgi:hypothetical protein
LHIFDKEHVASQAFVLNSPEPAPTQNNLYAQMGKGYFISLKKSVAELKFNAATLAFKYNRSILVLHESGSYNFV